MAVGTLEKNAERRWVEEEVLVTPEAQERLASSDVWYHLGGWYDEGDTFDTQASQFAEELESFWALLIGPDEQLRRNIFRAVEYLSLDWTTLNVTNDGTVTIHLKDGSEKVLRAPVS